MSKMSMKVLIIISGVALAIVGVVVKFWGNIVELFTDRRR